VEVRRESAMSDRQVTASAAALDEVLVV
jgi:hypothetical protein